MEKNYHFIKQRLENLKTIKPMLMSLRTISLSSWKLSLKKLEQLKVYQQEIVQIANQVGLRLSSKEIDAGEEAYLVILGSTRGLCGGFNHDLFSFLEENQMIEQGKAPNITLLGEKMGKLFSSKQVEYNHLFSYPKVDQITFQYITDFVSQITSKNHHPSTRILYNTYQGSGRYKTIIRNVSWAHAKIEKSNNERNEIIIETDIQELSEFILNQFNLLVVYQSFLSSLAAEHSTRFQIMENAISNTNKLIQELGITVQVERQKKITSEMRELSISAGLLER
jgi:F-type H+-transporting ATPase subunit gamma